MALDCAPPEAFDRIWERATQHRMFTGSEPERSDARLSFWAWLWITGRLSDDGGPQAAPNVAILS